MTLTVPESQEAAAILLAAFIVSADLEPCVCETNVFYMSVKVG